MTENKTKSLSPDALPLHDLLSSTTDSRVHPLSLDPSYIRSFKKNPLFSRMWLDSDDTALELRIPLFGAVRTEIQTRFAGQEIGLRTILTSINGTQILQLFDSQMEILPVEQLLEYGSEKQHATELNIIPIGDPITMQAIPTMIERYFVKNTKTWILPNKSAQNAVFPAIAVYDTDPKTTPLRVKHPSNPALHMLPSDPDLQKKAIIGVYVCDVRPLFPKK